MAAEKNRPEFIVELPLAKLDQMNGFALDFGKRTFFALS